MDLILLWEDYVETRLSEIMDYLCKIGRSDIVDFDAGEFDPSLSIKECVKILLEKYPVKRISKKVYKPNPNPYL